MILCRVSQTAVEIHVASQAQSLRPLLGVANFKFVSEV